MEEKIYGILNDLGVPFGILGRQYLMRAVTLIYRNGRMAMTKELYPRLAKEFGTTMPRVERAIRHAVECVFNNVKNIEAIKKYFGFSVPSSKGKLTNADFIYGIVEYLRLHR